MARQVRDIRIDTREARKKLAKRREPYWLKITKGCYLGYRKLAGERGAWVAKFRDKAGRRLQRAIGAADDAMDADGATALDFAQAQAKARDWFQSVANGGGEVAAGRLTVNGAMDRYLKYIAARRKSHRHLNTGIEAYIRPRLGKVQVADLTAVMIRTWHEGIANEPPRLRKKKGAEQRYREEDQNAAEAKRKRQLRANRHLTTLKAALTLAWRDGAVQVGERPNSDIPTIPPASPVAKIPPLNSTSQRRLHPVQPPFQATRETGFGACLCVVGRPHTLRQRGR